MTTELAITTIAYGNQAVPLQRRPHWRPVPRCPYRRLKELTPTSRWFDLPAANAETLWETHVAQELGRRFHRLRSRLRRGLMPEHDRPMWWRPGKGARE